MPHPALDTMLADESDKDAYTGLAFIFGYDRCLVDDTAFDHARDRARVAGHDRGVTILEPVEEPVDARPGMPEVGAALECLESLTEVANLGVQVPHVDDRKGRVAAALEHFGHGARIVPERFEV